MDAFGYLGLEADSILHVKKLEISENQFDIFKKIYFLYDKVFILESLTGPKELSEISVIGFDPDLTITCDSSNFTVRDRKKSIYREKVEEPLRQLERFIPTIKNSRFRYIGGAVGYLCYDAVRFWENLPVNKKSKFYFPLLEFGIYTDGILYNHIENQAYYFHVGERNRLKQVEEKIKGFRLKKSKFTYSAPKRNMTKSHFVRLVKKAKKYVYDGDIFQVVLSKSIRFNIRGDIIAVYESLREINPSPYMYLLKMGDRCIVGSSPEMLIRITDRNVETFPIAGTRQVVEDQQKNEKLKIELLNDEKELAEHTMLVDLARNDIGRVCEYGSVKVDELMAVKKFSHVQHIVSHVTGTLDGRNDSYDTLRSVFPAGTVSGAPKVRAMEIIDELEPTLREPYAGALGYFSFNGSCDFAITIRSLFVNKKKAYVQSGAGIVMDSDPVKEWDETEHKANALLSAMKKASGKR